MSASESTPTPQRPASPSAIGWSESMPRSIGMSNAVDSPSPPALMISLKRQLVSSAVPNPANIPIVQRLQRDIDAYGPRVYGYWPGYSVGPSLSSLAGPETGCSGMPDSVLKTASTIGRVQTP